jgi:hypothetical protein
MPSFPAAMRSRKRHEFRSHRNSRAPCCSFKILLCTLGRTAWVLFCGRTPGVQVS